MIDCPRCGHPNPDQAERCQRCAAALRPSCPTCGRQVPAESQFCNHCGTRLPSPASTTFPRDDRVRQALRALMPGSLAQKIDAAAAEVIGERREVTVLFWRVAGLSDMTHALDSEATYLLTNQAIRLLAKVIYEYEGIIDAYTGDGLMALFGLPMAHENDPERAVRAALDMHTALEPWHRRVKERYGIDLETRIGIHTGLVIAGKVTDDLQVTYTVIGDTVKLADRLQDAAGPNAILASFETYQRTRPWFRYKNLPALEIDGKPYPIRVFQPLGLRKKPDQARGLPTLQVPMIGRQDACDSLQIALEQVRRRNHSRIALITGEAGVGKSRLLSEFRERVIQSGIPFYQGNCLTYTRSRPLHPVVSVLREMLYLIETDPVEMQREAVRAYVDQLDVAKGDVLPYLYHVLGLAQSEPRMEARIRHLDDATLQKLTHSALQQVFLSKTRMETVVLAFEDLHWVDPASRDFIGHLVQTLDDVPVMVILVSRDTEGEATIQPLLAATKMRDDRPVDIQLRPLSEPECVRLVSELIQITTDEAQTLRQRIVERADGNPFYAEEIVRMLIDQDGLVCRDGTWQVMPEAKKLVEDVPGTLNGLILARLDRLSEPLRRTLQKAAVLGSAFPLSLIQSLNGSSSEEIAKHIEALEMRQFLVPTPYGLDQGCAFQHTLVQETVYRTLLRRDRQELHGRSAEAIEKGDLWPTHEQTEALAYHYAESAQPAKAIPYLIAAAENAARRCAYETAVPHYRRVLALLQPQSPVDTSTLSLQIDLGRAQYFLGEYAEASQTLDQALHSLLPLSLKTSSESLLPTLIHGLIELANIRQREGVSEEAISLLEAGLSAMGDKGSQEHPQLWRSVIERMAWVRFRQGKLEEAFSLASTATLGLDVESQDDPMTLANLYNTLGGIRWQQGDLAEAIVYVERRLELCESLGYLWGMANAQTNLGILHYAKGQWAVAAEKLEQAEAVQKQIGDLQSRAIILNNLGTLRQSMGAHDAARRDLETSLDIRRRLGDTWGVAQAHIALGRLALVQHRFDDAIVHVQAALSTSGDLGAYEIEARWVLAQSQAQEDLQLGLQSAERALQMARDAGLQEQEADCRRVLGILRARTGEYVEAESLLRESVELCVQLNNPYGRGLALLELGRLYDRMASMDRFDRTEWHTRALGTLTEAAEQFERLGAAYDLEIAQTAIREHPETTPESAPVGPGDRRPGGDGIPEGEWRTATIIWLNLSPLPDADEEAVFEAVAPSMPTLIAFAREGLGREIRHPGGLTVVFGAPTAYEDDAERAVQTAWRMARYLSEITAPDEVPLAYEIAVSQGTVVAGQSSSLLYAEFTVTGEAVREARRVAESAPRGVVWVTEAIRAATERTCLYEPAPPDLAGLSDLSLWSFVGFREHPSPARGLPGIRAKLVGRETPFQTMLDLSANLARGIGGLIWIEGEPGIGKSRLMHEFVARRGDDGALLWTGQCSPQRSGYAFSLFSDLLARAFGVQPSDTSEETRAKVERTLDSWPRDAQVTRPYLELLLGVEPWGVNGKRLLSLQPEQLRQQTFVSLRRLFKSLANQGPLVIALDDLHWIDPISAEMLQFLLTIVASAPILFVCAQRRQGADAPNDRLVRIQSLIPMQTVRLRLERLSAEESEVLLTELLSGSELPLMLRTSILEQSEGNPYFIEEFVRMLIEQGHLQYRDDRWTIAPNLPPDQVPVPSSLETLIRARLDALPPELKDLLQCAAIVGAPFEGDLLHAVSGQPNVEAALRRLESRLLVHRGHEANQWLFSHSLIEGVAYDGMLRTRREALHLKAAQVLETRWAGTEAEHAKVLAYHYVRADRGGKALTYLMTAGEQAAAQSANEEAIGYFEQAAERLSARPDAPDSIRWRLAAGMGDVYRSTGQYADSMVALKAGLALVQVGQLPTGFRAGLYRRLGETAQKQGDLNLAYEYYHNALSALDELSDDWLRTEAARSMAGLAWVHFLQGRFEQALQACQVGLDHAREADALNELAAAENLLGGIYWRQSEWALALQHARRAMVLREQMGYTWGVASTLANLGILAFLAGEWNKAMSYFERSLALRQEMGDVEGMTIVHNNMGLVTRDQGHLDEAEEHFRESLSLATRFEIGYHIANSGIGLAQVLLKKGEIDAARKAIDAALEQTDVVGAGDLRAEAYHILAQILMAESKWDEAVVVAKRSAGMAAESGNRALEASAWRVVSEIELDRHAARAACEALAQAQEVLADVTDELEIGRVSAQAGRIDLHEGHIAQAQEHLHAAQRIFVRLGAALDLRHVEEALRVR